MYTVAPQSLNLVLLMSNDAAKEAPQGDMLHQKSYAHGLTGSPSKQGSGSG